jgi:SHS2 domain-containing protein
MTDLSTVVIDDSKTVFIEVKGHDMQSLLFAFMDEMLFRFCTEAFICAKIDIIKFDKEAFKIDFKAHGNVFDQAIHPQGTEIKAITYSNMQIHETDDRADIYVIVDI